MSLAPLSIATKGYVCGFDPRDISIATKGYVCIAVVPPIDPSLLGGGHGAVIRYPRERVEEREDLTDVQLALIAVALIDDLYE